MKVEAELHTPAAVARLARFQVEPDDYVLHDEDAYWLDLALTPRSDLRARRLDSGEPHHFLPVGGLLLVPAGQAYEFKTDGGNTSSVVCLLRRELFHSCLEHELEWTDRRMAASLNIADASIRGLLLRLARELRFPNLASSMMAELIAGQIAIELARHFTSIQDAPASGGLASWRLRLIDEKLSEPGPPPTLLELAGLCKISIRQLTRGFRTSRGCTLGAYMAHTRGEVAKRLLATNPSVKAVARSMGFASPSSFSYAFRRTTGMSPRQFQGAVVQTDKAHRRSLA